MAAVAAAAWKINMGDRQATSPSSNGSRMDGQKSETNERTSGGRKRLMTATPLLKERGAEEENRRQRHSSSSVFSAIAKTNVCFTSTPDPEMEGESG